MRSVRVGIAGYKELRGKVGATMITSTLKLKSTTGSHRTNDPARLNDVITTAQLARRPSRPPQHAAENDALIALARTMATSPRSVLHKLVSTALGLTGAGSAGISIAENAGGASVFRWRATAGAFAAFEGGTMPRDFSPCGVVLDRNATQLMADPVRYWPYIADLYPHVAEVLLVPFYGVGDVPLGTLWAVDHPSARAFDAEDARLMQSLSRFTSAAVV
jgi:hypothetical protein